MNVVKYSVCYISGVTTMLSEKDFEPYSVVDDFWEVLCMLDVITYSEWSSMWERLDTVYMSKYEFNIKIKGYREQ
jgi:hypothetical protein